MGKQLEEKLEEPELGESWLKRAFKKEWPTMINHVIAGIISTGAATGFSHVADNSIESDALISGAATAIDFGSYWGTFIPQLLYRDRNKLKLSDGRYSSEKIGKKTLEYASMMGVVEGIYFVGRFFGQYALQKRGWNPAAASATVQVTIGALFTLAYPPMRYALEQFSERRSKNN